MHIRSGLGEVHSNIRLIREKINIILMIQSFSAEIIIIIAIFFSF